MIRTLLAALLLTACKSPKPKDNGVESSAFKELASRHGEKTRQLKEHFLTFVASSKDSSERGNMHAVYNSFLETDKFLDSIQIIVQGINNTNVKGVEAINELLIKGELGDSLHKRLVLTFKQAQGVAIPQRQRAVIDSIRRAVLLPTNANKDWQDELFGLTDPFGASLILSGLREEVLNAGIIIFTKY